MANLFAKAAKKIQEGTPSKAKKRSTVWPVGNENAEVVAKAIHELTVLNSQAKAIDAKMGPLKTVVFKHAYDSFLRDYSDIGCFPDTPMQVVNADGEKATFVVQDRSAQYNVKPEQLEALVDLFGEDGANELVATETVFKFNRLLMMKPGVADVVSKHLEAAITELADGGLLPDNDVDLIEVDQKTAFKPGTLDRLALICGKSVQKMRQFLDVMSSSCCKYVKCG